MVPKPEAVGLWICERVIVEEGVRSISVIASHTRRRYRSFPTPAETLFAFAILTGGHGSGRMEVRILDTQEMDVIAERSSPIQFADPAVEVLVSVRFRDLSLPREGMYSVGLFVDDDLIAERCLRVLA